MGGWWVGAVHARCGALETPQGNVSRKPVAPLFHCVLRGGCRAYFPCHLRYSQEITTTRVDDDRDFTSNRLRVGAGVTYPRGWGDFRLSESGVFLAMIV